MCAYSAVSSEPRVPCTRASSSVAESGTDKLWTNFAYPDQWMNNVAPRFMHPVNPVTAFKLARAKVTKLGETDLAHRMSFLPRNIAPQPAP